MCLTQFCSVWQQCYLPIVSSLGKQSIHASRDIRHLALVELQRILLGQLPIPSSDDGSHAAVIFERVIFPLLEDLLEPQVFNRDPKGMAETRLRASALLCKVFMQFEVNDSSKTRDIRGLWLRILDLLDDLMNVNKRDQLVRFRFPSTIPFTEVLMVPLLISTKPYRNL